MGRNRAIVLGYSMAGKLAARVLIDHFQEVLVLERDARPTKPIVRKGVPQGDHPHVLLKKGAELIESFFPRINEDLIEQGAVAFDFTKDVYWVHHGRKKVRFSGGFRQLSQSRPLLEWVIQQRLEAFNKLTVMYETSASGLDWSEDGGGVQGVTFKTGEKEQKLEADLIIDTTGAASFFQQAFRKQGIPFPEEERVDIQLTYTSQKIKWEADVAYDWKTLILYPDPPYIERGGLLYPLENNDWMAALVSYGSDLVPANPSEFIAFAESLTEPMLSRVLKKSEPLSEMKTYKFPKQYWRRMDKERHLPTGLIVMGDALCRFDPVFGQGMTAASLEAKVLQDVLNKTTDDVGSTPFIRQVYKRFAKQLSPLWLMVLAEDFMYSKTKGKQPFGLSILQRYMQAVYKVSEYDQATYRQFSRVLHLLDSPFTLFKPSILGKVMKKGWR